MASDLQGFIIKFANNTADPNAVNVVHHVINAILTSVTSGDGSIPNSLYTDINAITSNLPVSLEPYDKYNFLTRHIFNIMLSGFAEPCHPLLLSSAGLLV